MGVEGRRRQRQVVRGVDALRGRQRTTAPSSIPAPLCRSGRARGRAAPGHMLRMKKHPIALRRESIRPLSTQEIEKAAGGLPVSGGTTTIVDTIRKTVITSFLDLCI